MRSGVIVFPGSNCDHDCFHVLKEVTGGQVDMIWHETSDFGKEPYDLIVVPGGFSYGDYLRAGALAHFAPAMKEIKRHADNGGLVIGICNGFQILTESQLLPGVLMRNTCMKFICKHIYLKVENNNSPMMRKYSNGQVIRMPIAHGEGNYQADQKVIDNLKKNNQIVFKYCSENGETSEPFNPNGSIDNIAGICNERGNVIGLMPHPERCSEEVLGCADGRLMFQSAVEYAAARKIV
ncbi:MAG: phosphoribosylformylglycinamidine synthase I [Candidatus Margulisiibacteriota bacterium]|nr:MAG: phosphoribosylformylglycinamidine synthase I [Candidatus Margulisbacteria bacterium GWD2_39_127]OGI04160.1 MAG: phosphoribosylformylglycinamidine synthase I [Candidatus Margulisbacteria bacterium GWF2_38_17]OGI09307.1 MAG: phosphoribosylformylglycinamidine synthase I [Candidatus Margulisbacteria bacterium GWE2_39_32]PZM77378.1 MAG: phosphoribosylformylglycinamidine synthase I [Candidatus Margulisiibacteriota bacterium]HAR63956.1 phosphoribosylformylglycinamidine synthase I [Candidatus M